VNVIRLPAALLLLGGGAFAATRWSAQTMRACRPFDRVLAATIFDLESGVLFARYRVGRTPDGMGWAPTPRP
jgi:hypothetical protein